MASNTQLKETITVEVAGKWGPKANGKYYGLKRPLQPTDFEAGKTYDVLTEPWAKGEKSGVNIVQNLGETRLAAIKKSIEIPERKQVEIPQIKTAGRDFDKEARGKTKCALYEAALQSPYLATVAKDQADFLAKADTLVEHCFNQIFAD